MKKIFVTLILFVGMMSNVLAQEADYLFMIAQAVKAPSGHNTQPWLFKIADGEIDIIPDFTKSLPVVDPNHRELFVSLGCAAENLCIAAAHKGYESRVAVTNEGVIRVLLAKQSHDVASPLFAQIPLRQTNRSRYDGKIIPEDSIALLKNVAAEPSIAVHFYKNGSLPYAAITEMVYAGNHLQMHNKAFKEELQLWMRYNKKHQDATKDGLSYAVFGAPNVPKFIAKPIMAKAINEKKQNKSDSKNLASASHLVLLTSKDNTIEQWVSLGRTLERILLRTTQMGIAHAYLNQPNEEASLSGQLAQKLGLTNEYPTILIRIGYGKKMPYSLRREGVMGR